MRGTCAACGGILRPHLRVAGAPGAEGLTPTTDRFGTALSDIVQCATCGHMQLAEQPDEQFLAQAYADASSTDYLEEEPGQRATARGALAQIEAHRAIGRLLDLGCWAGFLLDEARLRGWQVSGVEPSAFASAYARRRLGLEVQTTDMFAADLDPSSFDAIVLGDVIEHLADPGRALDRIASLAQPGAVLYLTLPDAGSRVARLLGRRWWSVIPTHIHYFTRRSLAALLARCGWELLDMRTAPKTFTVRYYLGRVGGYSLPLSDALVAAAARAGIADKPWAPDFRDRLAALARAPHPARVRSR